MRPSSLQVLNTLGQPLHTLGQPLHTLGQALHTLGQALKTSAESWGSAHMRGRHGIAPCAKALEAKTSMDG